MKILFVDQSDDLQAKWIEPLRKKGWGVVRARSAEDAGRMLYLHGDAVEAIVTGERFVTWAEKQELPFIVLTTAWNDTAVVKHQNSAHAAIAYLTYEKGMEELYALFENPSAEMKATGTDGIPLDHGDDDASELIDYSGILNQPDPASQRSSSFKLDAPNILLGGKVAAQEVKAPALDHTLAMERTVVLSSETNVDRTRLHVVKPEVEEMPMVDEDEAATRIFSSIPTPPAAGLHDDDDSEGATKLMNMSGGEIDLSEHLSPPPPPPPPPAYNNAYAQPVSQFAVNPSPGASVSDLETLRSYVALREQDVAVLSGQVRSAQERIQQLELQVKIEKVKSAELAHLVSKQEQKIKNYDQEKQVELEVLERQVDDIDQQLKDRTDKVRTIEAKLRLTLDEVGKVKDRVRVDIRRIRVREKELEGQLEILKKDSSALLQARDEKILELKRKIDLLEFNMELVQEQFTKEKQSANDLKTKLKDAAQVMRQAGGLLGTG